jgi:hypothetical protein
VKANKFKIITIFEDFLYLMHQNIPAKNANIKSKFDCYLFPVSYL